jgi:PKD repeat protein
MKAQLLRFALASLILWTPAATRADVRYVDVNSAAPSPPYTNWSSAAVTIQDAVDVSVPGDQIIVTNGVYRSGGRQAGGTSTTNRVAVDKPITVASVNGPAVTVIEGRKASGGGYGTDAIRCVYLADGAVFIGFTLTNGATYEDGGGVYCQTVSALLTNCVVISNSAASYGGGVYYGTLNNCTLTGNSASSYGGGAYESILSNCTVNGNSTMAGGGAYYGTLNNCTLLDNSATYGGGAYEGTLNNCAMVGNSASSTGGGMYGGTLNNCTITGNSASSEGGGASFSTLNSCIIYYNAAPSDSNYFGGTLNYCCTAPQSGGTSNIVAEPQLASVSHLSAGSPCRGAGSTNYATGVDIDGEAWANPPSIGCDEYQPGALTGPLSALIRSGSATTVPGWPLSFMGQTQGRTSATRWDFGDGTVVSNWAYATHTWHVAGSYAVVLTAFNEDNPGGVSATQMVHVVNEVHYVALDSPNPQWPYTSWGTAATNIQDAVDAVVLPGSLVLVSNGVYRTGGRLVSGISTTNRVAVTNVVTLRSMNGPTVTVIEGRKASGGGNGVDAVRCVYLANGAVLAGFSLTNGATGSYDYSGGAYCQSTSAWLTNCLLIGNSGYYGGGAYYGTLDNCTLTGNSGYYGGGTYYGTLNNCTLTGNSGYYGGGACYGTLNNCTLTGNSAASSGGGAYGYSATLNNCILYYNTAPSGSNYYGVGSLNYCCTAPQSGGTSNIVAEPQLASVSHLSAGSPCRGAGSTNYARGVDIDGEAWANPPSIGCDEYQPGALIGPLSVFARSDSTNTSPGWPVNFTGETQGRTSATRWDFGDGTLVTNQAYASHTWQGPGDYLVVLAAYNEDHPDGVSSTVTVHVVEEVHYVALDSPNPRWPYTSWGTAATDIQQAVDAVVLPGSLVLVSNGVYRSGGRLVSGMSTTNRVAVTNVVTLRSVNGPTVTVIEGRKASGGGNGVDAVRCVYLTNGAVLAGFSLTNGATGSYDYGGGAYCQSVGAVLNNCVLVGNSAYDGAGAYYGTLNNCTLTGNSATYGGGAYEATLNNSVMTGNSASSTGGGAYDGVLNNCTVTGNSASDGGGAAYGTLNNCTLTGNSASDDGGGAYGYSITLNNCIVYYNTAPSGSNYYGVGGLNYCCTAPQSAGTSNIVAEPQLASVSHLSAGSPCRGAGTTNYATGFDIDGEAWGSPPSIGCDEYQPGALTGPLRAVILSDAVTVSPAWPLNFVAQTEGRTSATRWDFGDGTVVSNRAYASHTWRVAGDYVVVLMAYNEDNPDGVSASLTVHVVEEVHYVALDSPNPQAPYTSWGTAATNIQHAVDAVVLPGSLVLVSNGLYSAGGRPFSSGGTTNRVTVDKAITMASVNGPAVTLIQGQPAGGGGNGSDAVRCAYLTNGAVLVGFTLTNGATTGGLDDNGGGVYCQSVSAVVSNCVLIGNSAADAGGGSYSGTLNNCVLTGNSAYDGGGAYDAALNNCAINGNSAADAGGGVYSGTLNNCTLTGNSASFNGGGACYGSLTNCLVYYNGASSDSNYYGSALNYCFTTPLPWGGTSNRVDEPQLVSAFRISPSSPCVGAGNPSSAAGVDTDGDPWRNPPSVGCDEPWANSNTGPLAVAIKSTYANVAIGFAVSFAAQITGQASGSAWNFGDGTTASNRPYASHAWSNAGDYEVILTAYNPSNPGGVSARATVHVFAAPMHYVALDSANPLPPYLSWGTAATNLQQAVDAAFPGGTVLASNGVYNSGERVMAGNSTANRLAVFKPLTVASVNGPEVTVIVGKKASAGGDGPDAVRCVYLVDGVVLAGFTLTNGATSSSDNGGGVCCQSTNAWLTNCVLIGNSAYYYGGGAYSGTLNNCTLIGNSVSSVSYGYGGGAANSVLTNCSMTANAAPTGGGGTYSSTLENCTLSRNSASGNGGGAYQSTLRNCAVGSNLAASGGGIYGGMLYNCTVIGNTAKQYGGGVAGDYSSPPFLCNCIVYYNSAASSSNYYYGSFYWCCTTPSPGGSGNTNAEPQLVDWSHLSVLSPCRGAGSPSYAAGVDIDGEVWGSPPSIGCDEYWSNAITGPLSVAIQGYTNVPVKFAVNFAALISGRASMSVWDFGDGMVVSNRPYASHSWTNPGDYQVVLTAFNQSNPVGVRATNLLHVGNPLHFVATNSFNPQSPYLSWDTAATNIQQAIDAAVYEGSSVLVSNGIYASGGRVMFGSMSNRVAVTRPITVRSLNGPAATVVQGRQVATTNGDYAVRCVYLTNGAVLDGFTLTGGATRGSSGDLSREQKGGGAWCVSTNAVLTNCVLSGNFAYASGGGAEGGTLYNCSLTKNSAPSGGGADLSMLNNCALTGNAAFAKGGGAYQATLNNCILTGNTAATNGGGAYSGKLNNCALSGNSAASGGGVYLGMVNNCTLTGNWATNSGGGSCQSTQNNCIVYYNTALNGISNNYAGGVLNYCCTMPQPSGGAGNIVDEPQLASSSHIGAGSPCRGRGNAVYAIGVDIDGETWDTPPSIGCDEYGTGAGGGPLSVAFKVSSANAVVGSAVSFTAQIDGWTRASCWDFGDGTVVSNRPYASHAWYAVGDYLIELRAYNDSNPGGVSATALVHVVEGLHYVARDSANPRPPYTSWDTAATNIQDAVDAAADLPGCVVLVSNGVYAAGGRKLSGSALTNRLVVNKPLTVRSLNGAGVTSIEGYQVGSAQTGDAAVRCVYLTNGAVLAGFTLANGATRGTAGATNEQIGGGVLCESANAVLTNCVLLGNAAYLSGGAVYRGTLQNCTLTGNRTTGTGGSGGGACNSTLINCILTANAAYDGGGACSGALVNCALARNSARWRGGGAAYASLTGCTVTGNFGPTNGGGVYFGAAANSIIYGNAASAGTNYNTTPIFDVPYLQYCCTLPWVSTGTGNLIADPILLADGIHLATNSPCRSKGYAGYASGTDIDGQAWANPPAMGCDEWRAEPALMNLPITPVARVNGQVEFHAVAAGQPPFTYWWTKDGAVLADPSLYVRTNASDLRVRVTDPAVAGGYQLVASNAFGVVTGSVNQIQLHFVDANGPNPTAPYLDWTAAATNLTQAVNTAQPGHVIVVTNGIYADIDLAKPVTVVSVNGAEQTIIQAAAYRRCASLVDGAGLGGFTLRNGAPSAMEGQGGGVACDTTNAVVANCIITNCTVAYYGGGALYGTLNNCTLAGNSVTNTSGKGGGSYFSVLNNCKVLNNSATGLSGEGGGAYGGTLNSSLVLGNRAYRNGGGVSTAALNNCTVRGNGLSGSGGYGGGVYYAGVRNSIVYYNSSGGGTGANYYGGSFEYCCTTPLTGISFSDDPQFLADGFHIGTNSPCWEIGRPAYASGTDIDGQPWASPPSIGCDEWQPDPVIMVQPGAQVAAGIGQVGMGVSVIGQAPFTCWWTKDGALLTDGAHYASTRMTNLLINAVGPADRGAYQIVVSNSFGMVTSQVAKVWVHCVNGAGLVSSSPYTNWTQAATNIQDAVAVAAAGSIVLVTNGTYAKGGDTGWSWPLTNRVMVWNPVVVMSVNGPAATVIQGAWDPGTTNGPSAARCVMLFPGAGLNGFTLQGGATLSSDLDPQGTYLIGGGVWCYSQNEVVANCFITGNSAKTYGGGVYQGSLRNCVITKNTSVSYGGGAYAASLNNCTVVSNSAGAGGGTYSGSCYNSIVYYNNATNGANYYSGYPYLDHCCTTPQPGLGGTNITSAPLFVDLAGGNLRLQTNSPCINAGLNVYVAWLADLDGNPRIAGGTVDMGAYECQWGALQDFYLWLRYYGLPTDGSADYADSDHDGMNNWQEWRSGTNPTNALSVLRLLSAAPADTNVTVTWQSAAGVRYFLERGTNLGGYPQLWLLATNILGQADRTSYTDTNVSGISPRFYRVGIGE